jgi:hypothetical protein
MSEMKKPAVRCPKCDHVLREDWVIRRAAEIKGSRTSEAKAAAAIINGRKGGRPRKYPLPPGAPAVDARK